MADPDERKQQILNAAITLIVQQGYDKTTMGEIAAEAGVSRGTVYLYFKDKQELFEALLYREVRHYAQAWLDHFEADPRGGTIGGIYRAFLYAVNSRPFMAALLRRDRRILGNYLRQPSNRFAALQAPAGGSALLQALQAVGAVRPDVDPVVMAYIIDVLGYGLLSVPDFRNPEDVPPFDDVIETIADLLDRLLTPEDGGNSAAGKAVIRQFAATVRAAVDQIQPAPAEKDAGAP